MQNLHLTLNNHHFEVPCEEDERQPLIHAAQFLEEKLSLAGHLKGESKLLMVALNLSYEYLQLKQDTLNYTDQLEQQLAGLLTQLQNVSESQPE